MMDRYLSNGCGKQDVRSADPEATSILTTLYDLITALQEDVPPHDDDEVITMVKRLLQRKYLTWLDAHPMPDA